MQLTEITKSVSITMYFFQKSEHQASLSPEQPSPHGTTFSLAPYVSMKHTRSKQPTNQIKSNHSTKLEEVSFFLCCLTTALFSCWLVGVQSWQASTSSHSYLDSMRFIGNINFATQYFSVNLFSCIDKG